MRMHPNFKCLTYQEMWGKLQLKRKYCNENRLNHNLIGTQYKVKFTTFSLSNKLVLLAEHELQNTTEIEWKTIYVSGSAARNKHNIICNKIYSKQQNAQKVFFVVQNLVTLLFQYFFINTGTFSWNLKYNLFTPNSFQGAYFSCALRMLQHREIPNCNHRSCAFWRINPDFGSSNMSSCAVSRCVREVNSCSDPSLVWYQCVWQDEIRNCTRWNAQFMT